MSDSTIIKPPIGNRGFGRRIAHDLRDANFRAARLTMPPLAAIDRISKYWYKNPSHLPMDQGATPQCVAFSAETLLYCGPTVNTKNPDPHGLYQLAQQLDEWPGECVDTKTKCLSSKGWVGPDELAVGDEILTFDMQREGLRWATVEAVHSFEDAPLRTWKHDQFEVATTDNHKWLVRNRNTEGAYSLVPTTELKSQHIVPRAAGSLLDQPEHSGYSDDFVELTAWVITEGSYRPDSRRGNGIVVSQKSHRSHVTALMERLGVARGYTKADGCHCWELSGDLAAAVRDAAPDRAHTVEWLRKLTKRQLRLFIDTCILADGTTIEGEKWGRLDRRTFYQNPGERLDSFLAACVMAGIPVSRNSEATANRSVEGWSLRASNMVEVRKLEFSNPYNGRVWCPQTSAGTFVAKREGTIFITGNSYDGTSVRAGQKALQQLGFIQSYLWASNAHEAASFLLTQGPVVFGTAWTDSMMEPVKTLGDFWLQVDRAQVNDQDVAGHAYCVAGVHTEKQCPDGTKGAFQIINSWGHYWGEHGRVWLSFSDADVLLSASGECALPTEIKVK